MSSGFKLFTEFKTMGVVFPAGLSNLQFMTIYVPNEGSGTRRNHRASKKGCPYFSMIMTRMLIREKEFQVREKVLFPERNFRAAVY